MADTLASPLESKLLQVLESIEIALASQASQNKSPNFDRFNEATSRAASGVEGLTRLTGTLAFHMARAVSGLVAFRQAVSATYDRLNDPMRVTRGQTLSTTFDRVMSQQTMSGQSRSVTFDRSMSRQWDLSGMPGGPGSGGAGARPGQPGQPPARSLRVTTGDHESKFDTVMRSLRTSVGTHSNQFQTSAQTIHTPGQKAAASSVLAASKMQLMVDMLGTAATVFVNVAGAMIKALDASLHAGAPDAWATLNKTFKLVMATIGKELTPIVAEFARFLQQLVKDWNELDEGTRKSVVGILMMVSGIELLINAVKSFVDLVKWHDRNFSFGGDGGKAPALQRKFQTADEARAYAAVISGAMTQEEATKKFGTREVGALEPKFTGIQHALPINKIDQAMGEGNWFWRQPARRAFNLVNSPFWVAKQLGVFDPDTPDPNAKKNTLSRAFEDRANPQFMGVDQAWRHIQANLMKGDDLDRQIMEIQLQANEHLAQIAGNTKTVADKAVGAKVGP